MRIVRTVYVARTAHDKDHVNKLVLPEFGVVELWLERGGTRSKSYLLPGSKPKREPTKKGTEPFQFAPGPQLNEGTWAEDASKEDRVKLKYHLFNPGMGIKEAKLELFRRWDITPAWTRTLKGAELYDGEHELEFPYDGGKTTKPEWDGSVAVSKLFPDGFLTVEHSPYKLRLVVSGEGICEAPVAYTYFHVLIDKVELEWGPVEVIRPKAEYRNTFKQLTAANAKPPAEAAAAPVKIYLTSNIFKKGHSMFDNSFFTEYQKMYGNGPEIPLFLKVWVRNSAGNPVVAPRALGTTKFLWDWESCSTATGNDFVDRAQNYDVAATGPKGQNCHAVRGGKRADDNAPDQVMFPQPGYAPADKLKDGLFPFKVSRCPEPRKWAAYSEAWTKGKLAGKTGVLFRPSRMAGDSWRAAVYCAHETDEVRKVRLNVDADDLTKICQPKLMARTGVFQVWRRVDFVRYMGKKAIAQPASIPGIVAFFDPAFMLLENKTPGVETYPHAEWNTAFKDYYDNKLNDAQKLLFDEMEDQWNAAAGIKFRTMAQFITAWAADHGDTYADAAADLAAHGITDEAKHASLCEDLAIKMLVAIFDLKMPAKEGVTLFHTMLSNNLVPKLASFTDGLAEDMPSGSDRKAAFLALAPKNAYPAPQSVEMTCAHEFGHHFFLPHPRNTGENTGASANNDYDAHDRAVNNCLMSYLAGARELCGFCRLRLRGWDKSKLDTDKTKNSK